VGSVGLKFDKTQAHKLELTECPKCDDRHFWFAFELYKNAISALVWMQREKKTGFNATISKHYTINLRSVLTKIGTFRNEFTVSLCVHTTQ
jgi:hypothetical protein